MTLEQASRYVEEAAANRARWISFTGGEPFLVYSLLSSLIEHTLKRGLLSEVVTNCNWATTRKKALELLPPLKDSGLNALNISVDDFHQEFIPLERVRNCYEVAKSLELKLVLMITVKKSSSITTERIRDIMKDPYIQVLGEERIPNPSALAIETHFAPIGRGTSIPRYEMQYKKPERQPCKQLLTDIGVRPKGDVLPCCGPLGVHEDSVIGNLEEESLSEILKKAWQNPWLRELHKTGDYLKNNCYVSRCHMCVESYKKE
jgi:radical SAM protein with 4Fe4S-binding SPASM domain